MDYAKKIEILEAERADLEADLSMVAAAITSEEEGSAKQQRLSADKHDLNQRIIAITNEITALLNLLSSQQVKCERGFDGMVNENLYNSLRQNLWENISRTASSRCPNFRRNLCAEWGAEGFWFCPVLTSLRSPADLQQIQSTTTTMMITAAHIIPHCCKLHAVAASMDFDVDDVQNGLLLCKTFEVAFDAQQWCFVPSRDPSRPFQILLCDFSIAANDVVFLDNRGLQMSEQPTRLKWCDLHDVLVSLPKCVSRRALMLHAVHTLAKHGISSAGMSFQVWQQRIDSPPGAIRDWLKDVAMPTETIESKQRGRGTTRRRAFKQAAKQPKKRRRSRSTEQKQAQRRVTNQSTSVVVTEPNEAKA
jgi:hypothetical protein